MQAVKELLSGPPTSVRFSATPVKGNKQLFDPSGGILSAQDEPPFRIEGRVAVVPRRKSPPQQSLWPEEEEADLCPRHSEHRQCIEDLQRSRLAQRSLRERLSRTPLWRVPVVKEPLPVDVEDFNPIEPNYSKLIKDVWRHARETVQNPEEALGFEETPAGRGVLPARSATPDALGWVKPQRRASSFHRWSDSPLRVGRPLSPTYKPQTQQGATLVNAEGYAAASREVGDLRTRGMCYRTQYQLPTLSSILKAKHAVFVKAKSPHQQQTPRLPASPERAASPKGAALRRRTRQEEKRLFTNGVAKNSETDEAAAFGKKANLQAAGSEGSAFPSLKVTPPPGEARRRQKAPPRLSLVSERVSASSRLSPSALVEEKSPRKLRSASAAMGSPRSPGSRASSPKASLSPLCKEASASSDKAKPRNSPRKAKNGSGGQPLEGEELQEFRRWRKEHARRLRRAERLASPEILASLRPEESCLRCVEAERGWEKDSLAAHLHTASKGGGRVRKGQFSGAAIDDPSSSGESEAEEVAPNSQALQEEPAKPTTVGASAVPLSPQALLVQPLPASAFSFDSPLREPPARDASCKSPLASTCCTGAMKNLEEDRSCQTASGLPAAAGVLLLHPRFHQTSSLQGPFSSGQQTNKSFVVAPPPPSPPQSAPPGPLLLFQQPSAPSWPSGKNPKFQSLVAAPSQPAAAALPSLVVASPARLASPFRRAKASNSLIQQLPPLTAEQTRLIRQAQFEWWRRLLNAGEEKAPPQAALGGGTSAGAGRGKNAADLAKTESGVHERPPVPKSPLPHASEKEVASRTKPADASWQELQGEARSLAAEAKQDAVALSAPPATPSTSSRRRGCGCLNWNCGAEVEVEFACGGGRGSRRKEANSSNGQKASVPLKKSSSGVAANGQVFLRSEKAGKALTEDRPFAPPRKGSSNFLKVPESVKVGASKTGREALPLGEEEMQRTTQGLVRKGASLPGRPKPPSSVYSCGLAC